ncbi:MAG: RluA family pseudouridine synthase [Candidatus Magasanikbacteria bacterium]|nr:RluA family pseudouridine synthase [Candidatus Magasanikbacteria bacterium]
MQKPNKITISKTQTGERLDVFLSKNLHVSRSQVQKMIKNEMVLVNNKLPKKPGDTLREHGIITITEKPASKQPSKDKPAHKRATTAKITKKIQKIAIVADTTDYMVVNKPTGMLTHPTMAGETNTLADFITKKYPRIKKIGEDPSRPGIVHRLDKEASGLMVIAKTQKMFNHLKEQFKNRTIEKEYTALVHGQVAREWGEINFRIARSKTNDRMAALPENQTAEGKEAKTEFIVEKQFVNFTLLKVKIYTGRMHQIRVHFLAYDHPLVGDPIYFQKKQKRVWDKKLGRLFLHSTKLGFTDLHGEKQTFTSPLPKELENFLKLLR